MRQATVLAAVTLAATAAGASALTDHFATIELHRTGDKATAAALVLDPDSEAAWVDPLPSTTRLQGSWYARPDSDIELIVEARNAKQRYRIEQRLVSYLNLVTDSDVVTIDLDASTSWLALENVEANRYRMNSIDLPEVDLTREQLIEVVRRQAPDYVDAATQCTTINDPPCELITDHELRIYVERDSQPEYVGSIRLYDR